MATRSFIAVKHSDGIEIKYRVIYCHFDGYPGHVGRILKDEYTTIEKVIGLIELGDLSYLSEGQACAYHRDKGQAYNPPMLVSYDELIEEASASWIEYVYIFDGDSWDYVDVSRCKVHTV